jgi:hypothetical protein
LPSRLILLKVVLQALPIYAFSVLAAPRSVLNTIKSLQRNFLWHGLNKDKKIALVSWDKICRPKDQGGLGIRDPSTMNRVLSAKIWWRWLKNPRDLWAKLWRKKYAPNTVENNLIRWNGDNTGSLIWTTAKQNRQIITQHTFWEIGNGETALFWLDSWQQWPALNAEEWSRDICAQATGMGLTKVADYWQNDHTENTWRCWHLDRGRINLAPQIDLTPLHEALNKRKIPIRNGEDILRWGYKPQGSYSTQEAYQLTAKVDHTLDTKLWKKIWNLKHWPKITFFLWLVSHSSILTWDNLLKRGFTGPSICTLCGKAEETLNHLLNTCPYTTQVWDQVAISMRTSDRLRDSVIETILNWRDQAFGSPYLNRVWQLLPGFVLWHI